MNSGDEVDPLSVMPRRYADATPEDFAAFSDAMQKQHANDEAFARANDAVVMEGPWDGVPAQPVAYIGIAQDGKRVRLPAIAESWRYSPFLGSFRPDATSEPLEITRRPAPGSVMIKRISLGRPIAGMVVGRAGGVSPVQSRGLIDGREYYFRARGAHWSFSVGGAEVVGSPDWYYEEPYGEWPDAGGISPDEAYEFIEKAAELYRAGTPTMVKASLVQPKAEAGKQG
ncbi:MAG: hypothetical protein EON57_01910 [Alphaproteobacteria bacterium]|nr:MAG: hypothetical protein EON57_01910 [Alphaproteobacteria bacterium]